MAEKLSKKLLILTILCLFAGGCEEDNEPVLKEQAEAKQDKPLLEITNTEYTILTREPNLLIIEVWDGYGGYQSIFDGVEIKTLRRVLISVPYTIEIYEPNKIVVLQKDRN
ncbi:MAG: hypothetical protein ACUZ9M_00545 [Candidatus Scalindua sp.]